MDRMSAEKVRTMVERSDWGGSDSIFAGGTRPRWQTLYSAWRKRQGCGLQTAAAGYIKRSVCLS